MLLREIVLKWVMFWGLDHLLHFVLDDIWWLFTLGAFAIAALWCVRDANLQCLWDKVITTYVVRPAERPQPFDVVVGRLESTP